MLGSIRNALGKPYSRKLATISAVFACIAVLVLTLTYLSFSFLGALRGFVTGESLWSKGQKDAVYYLSRYVETEHEHYFSRYEESIAVPLAIGEARIELLKPQPDLDLVRSLLLEAGIPEPDIGGMVRVFRHLRGTPHVRDAMRLWEAGDRHIARLDAAARELRDELREPAPSALRIDELSARIHVANEALTPLEREFSIRMARGARWARNVTFAVILVITGLVVAGGIGLSWRLLRTMTHSNQTAAENRALLDRVLETMLDGLVVLKSVRKARGEIEDFEWVIVNRAAERMLGRQAGDLIGRRVLPEMPGIVEDGLFDRFRHVIETGEPFKTEHYYAHDGLNGWFRLSVARMGDGITVTTANIADRKESEHNLRVAQAKFESLVNTVDGIVWEADGETFGFLYVSRQAERLLGYPVEDWLGSPEFWQDHIHPDDREWAVRYCVESMTKHPAYEFEYRMISRDGREVWLRDLVSVHEEGGRRLLRGIMLDVTHRMKAKLALEASERRFRALTESTGAGVALGRLNETLYVNPSLCRLLEYPAEELSARPLPDLVHPDHRESVREINRRQLNGSAAPAAYDAPFLTRTGKTKWLSVSSTVIDLDGIPTQLSTAFDITDRKIAETQLAASLAEKEILLKEIHHRVKNNLQIVSSLLSLQSAQLRDPHDVELFRESQNRVHAMAVIHEQLYGTHDFSRIDIANYIRNLVRNIEQTYKRADVRVNVSVEPVSLSLDAAVPCGLIINELLSNSLKYAFPPAAENGRPPGVVQVQLARDGAGKIIVRVTDNGVGMPAAALDGGTSTLGLQLVTTLVRQLRGEADFDLANGTACTITFPGENEYIGDTHG